MFSPSELEGEVDHTFFDSDCEDGSRQGERKTDCNLTIKNDITRLQSKPAALDKSKGHHENSDETKTSTKSIDKNDNKDSGNKGGHKSNQIFTLGSDNEEDIYFKNNNKHFMALLAEAKEVDEDDSEQSGKYSALKTDHVLKKPINSGHSSPVSSEANRDSDSESYYSDSSCQPKINRTSSSRDSLSRVGLSSSGDAHCGSADESDDTVTDVSPLSSPASSRLQSLDLNQSETEDDEDYDDDDIKEQRQSVPSSGFSTAQQEDRFSLLETDDYSLSSESRLDGKVVMQFPTSRQRKNYSFTNDEVQRIDRENQRLLRNLSRFSTGSRPGSASGQRHRITSSTPQKHLPHSALNRQREQQRIERENLAFLKRLESVKPSRGMKRSDQLADYQRQVGYLGVCPVYQSTSRASSAGKGLKPNNANHHSARASSMATTLSSTPVPRLRKTKAAQPTWS